MITKSKLANRPDNKLTKKFNPIDMSADYGPSKQSSKKSKSKARKFLLLLGLMIFVAGATFGAIWLFNYKNKGDSNGEIIAPEIDEPEQPEEPKQPEEPTSEAEASIQPITSATSANPTIVLGRLMLINPNFTVESDFIRARRTELISLQNTYGIIENNPTTNGDNLMDREAAEWLNKMIAAYTVANPGHTLETRSCFREAGTGCGRMCAATGASDHHTGLTCDLIDPTYGSSLDANLYGEHLEWQWLKSHSYEFGFIDRFPEAWAGGPMTEPANVNAEGTTGLFETWHYRYVGVYAATEIATGVYNNGQYDSLEHYLLMRGLVTNLLNN